jgi:type II secretory pathway pseudopilin PulG
MPRAATHRIAGSTFTLVEALVALAVLGLLAGILTPMFGQRVKDIRCARAIVACRRICAGLASYNDERGQFPPGIQGDPSDNFAEASSCGFGAEVLNTWLYDTPRKYIAHAIDRDPWGNAYNYRVYARNSEFFEVVVFSNGPNGVCDSWDRTQHFDGDFSSDDIGAAIEVRR